MTMFSMKPKFDLAEFLAVPAPAGSARYRASRSRGMQFQARPTPDAASGDAPVAEAAVTSSKAKPKAG